MIVIAKSREKFLLDKSFTTLLDARFGDIDQMCADVRHWDLDFHPLQTDALTPSIGRVIQGMSRRFQCAYARFLVNIDQRGAPPADKFTFGFPGRNLNAIWWQGQHVSQEDVLVYFPGTEMHSVTGCDFEVHIISLSEEDIERYADRCGLKRPSSGRLPSLFKAPTFLIEEARSLLGLMTSDPLSIDDCSLDLFAENLVRCWLGQIGLVSKTATSHHSDQVLDQVLAAVSQGNSADVRVSELCENAGLSRRALELAFRERFNMGPAAFLKSSRLVETRRRLSAASSAEASVGNIMALSGFSHVGQFARDYKRMFGELPSVTLESPSGRF